MSYVCEFDTFGKPMGTRVVPQLTTGLAKPLTQIEPGYQDVVYFCLGGAEDDLG